MEKSLELTIVATTLAEEGQESKLRAAQEILVAATLKEKGCIRYELHQSEDDPRILIFVETWASEVDWKAHMQGEAMQQFQASGATKLIVDFTLHKMKKISG